MARFDGTVTVGDRRLDLGQWPGMVGHNWGTQHAERWIWLHGMCFDGHGDDTWFDVVLGRIKVAGRTTPWVASGAVSLDGVRSVIGGPARIRSATVSEQPDHVSFTLGGAGVTLHGRVGAPRERFVGWTYADPDGSSHDTVNCSIADVDVTVRRGGTAPVRLRSNGLGAYELGMREHDHGITIQPFPDPQALSVDAEAAELVELLTSRGLTIATAESLTGGGLGERITSVPGSSVAYVGGVVSYATRVKESLLGIPVEVVEQYGVVSAECAAAMAAGIRSLLNADLGISTTGVAGPDGQEGKPAGLVYVGVADASGVTATELRLTGDRESVRAQTCAAALRAARAAVR